MSVKTCRVCGAALAGIFCGSCGASAGAAEPSTEPATEPPTEPSRDLASGPVTEPLAVVSFGGFDSVDTVISNRPRSAVLAAHAGRAAWSEADTQATVLGAGRRPADPAGFSGGYRPAGTSAGESVGATRAASISGLAYEPAQPPLDPGFRPPTPAGRRRGAVPTVGLMGASALVAALLVGGAWWAGARDEAATDPAPEPSATSPGVVTFSDGSVPPAQRASVGSGASGGSGVTQVTVPRGTAAGVPTTGVPATGVPADVGARQGVAGSTAPLDRADTARTWTASDANTSATSTRAQSGVTSEPVTSEPVIADPVEPPPAPEPPAPEPEAPEPPADADDPPPVDPVVPNPPNPQPANPEPANPEPANPGPAAVNPPLDPAPADPAPAEPAEPAPVVSSHAS